MNYVEALARSKAQQGAITATNDPFLDRGIDIVDDSAYHASHCVCSLLVKYTSGAAFHSC